jgi:hypothetical protein
VWGEGYKVTMTRYQFWSQSEDVATTTFLKQKTKGLDWICVGRFLVLYIHFYFIFVF